MPKNKTQNQTKEPKENGKTLNPTKQGSCWLTFGLSPEYPFHRVASDGSSALSSQHWHPALNRWVVEEGQYSPPAPEWDSCVSRCGQTGADLWNRNTAKMGPRMHNQNTVSYCFPLKTQPQANDLKCPISSWVRWGMGTPGSTWYHAIPGIESGASTCKGHVLTSDLAPWHWHTMSVMELTSNYGELNYNFKVSCVEA